MFEEKSGQKKSLEDVFEKSCLEPKITLNDRF
jgi:hypothetical protein